MIGEEQVTGNWNELKGKIQQHWGQLTDDELQEVEGRVDQLVGLIQQKTGQARQQIEQTIAELSEECSGLFGEASAATREYVNRAGDAVRSAAHQVTDRTQEGYAGAKELVRQRPAESVAVAFGTGLIAGVIVGLLARSR